MCDAKFIRTELILPKSNIPGSNIEIKLRPNPNKISSIVEIYLNGELVDVVQEFNNRNNKYYNNECIYKTYRLQEPLTQLGVSHFQREHYCSKCNPNPPSNKESIFYRRCNIYTFGAHIYNPNYDDNDDGVPIIITTIIPDDDLMSFSIVDEMAEIYKIHEKTTRKCYYNLYPEYDKFGKQLWDRKYEQSIVDNIKNYIQLIDIMKTARKESATIPFEFNNFKKKLSDLVFTTNQITSNIQPITHPKEQNDYDDTETKTLFMQNITVLYTEIVNLTEQDIAELTEDSYRICSEFFDANIKMAIQYIKHYKHKVWHIDIKDLNIDSIDPYW